MVVPVHTFWRFCAILTFGGVGVGVCSAALIPGAATVVSANHYTGDLAKSLKPLDERTIVYAADGSEIGKLGREDREQAKLGEVPQSLVEAVVVTEDATFYTNPGVDLEATVRALAANLGSGGIRQGGSTITQQLIKNRIVGIKQDLARKMREAILAFRINANYSKNDILEQYLNTVYFGEGSYGVKAAAERLFISRDPTTGAEVSKNLSQLTIADSALLAGLISNPSGNNPVSNPAGATARRNLVVRRMLEKHYITIPEAATAIFTPVPRIPPPAELRPDNYYVQEVQQLIEGGKPDNFGLGTTESERTNKLLGGGLRIYTAYNPTLQDQAVNAIHETLPDDTNGASAALVAMDPANGDVLAAANGAAFADTKYDYSTQGTRQEGSTYKAITLVTALENGFSPNDTVDGSDRCKIPGYETTPQGVGRNASDGEGGVGGLFNQTAHSVNCAFLRLQQAVGSDKVADMAVKLGIRNRPVDKNCSCVPASLTLGTVAATPLEMATVYNTLAADGIRHDPVFIKRIENSDGKVLYKSDPAGVRVISAQTARTVTKMLQGVITGGTGTRADIGRPAAGKTGTTDGEVDAWFDGYVPQLTAVVWMGNPEGEIEMGSIGQFSAIFGGTYPAMIWSDFMSHALDGKQPIDFIAPDEGLWPSGRFITVKGRDAADLPERPLRSGSSTTTTVAPPPTTAPAATTTTTAPPVTTTTTAPAGP